MNSRELREKYVRESFFHIRKKPRYIPSLVWGLMVQKVVEVDYEKARELWHKEILESYSGKVIEDMLHNSSVVFEKLKERQKKHENET